jgi:hypothetical protein
MAESSAKAAQQQDALLLQLPQEVWQEIIANISCAQDLQALASTCRDLHAWVMSYAAQLTVRIDVADPEAPCRGCMDIITAASARSANGSLDLQLAVYSSDEDVTEESQQQALAATLRQLGTCTGVRSLRLQVSRDHLGY